MAKEAVGSVDLDAVVNLDDMERAAQRVMDRQDFDYFAGGARPVTFDRMRIVDPYRYSRHVRPREPDLPLTAIPRIQRARRRDRVHTASEPRRVLPRHHLAAMHGRRLRREHDDARPGAQSAKPLGSHSHRAGRHATRGAP